MSEAAKQERWFPHAVREARARVETGGLNLVLLADSFLPHSGGSRVYYYQLYKNLIQQFPDRVTVLTKKVRGWEEFDARESGDALRIIRRFRPLPDWKCYRVPQFALPLPQTWRFVQSHPVDLIHAGDLFPQGVIAMLLKKFLGIPYVAYCHGEEITQTDYRRLQPLARNAIYRSADGVIAANEFARRNLMRTGVPEAKIYKVLPGVDSERFSPRPPNPEIVRRYGLQGKTVLLSVGRLVERKGHAVVLRALAQIRNRIPDFHYLIAGEGVQAKAILALASEMGLSDKVDLLGRVPNEQLPELYNICDLFVLGNCEVEGDLEGFGMVFLEASASGKAVLGGRTGGTSEAVIENATGMLVDPENISEFASALELLLSNADLRRRLGMAGLRRATTEFSWPVQARVLREACWNVLRNACRNAGRHEDKK